MARNDVAPERTGWRDQGLSERHRKWGWNCPAVDVDFLLLEFDRSEPIALVEYKHEAAALQYASHPSYQALIKLGDRAAIPVFAVRYNDDYSQYRVVPLNAKALEALPQRTQMDERRFVTFMYALRGYTLPDDLFEAADIEI